MSRASLSSGLALADFDAGAFGGCLVFGSGFDLVEPDLRAGWFDSAPGSPCPKPARRSGSTFRAGLVFAGACALGGRRKGRAAKLSLRTTLMPLPTRWPIMGSKSLSLETMA